MIIRIFALFALLQVSSSLIASDESWSYKDWELTSHETFVRYISHGSNIHGHQFGFIKKANNCSLDIMWISWSASGDDLENQLNKHKNIDVTIGFNVDNHDFQLSIPFISSYSVNSAMTITAFSNFSAGEKLISLLKKGSQINVTLIHPNEFVNIYDIKHDSFSLNGFTAMKLKAFEYCENLNKNNKLNNTPKIKNTDNSRQLNIENHGSINIAKADQYIQSIVDEMLKNQRIDQAITRILNIASEKDEKSRALTCGVSQKLFVESIIRRTALIDEGKIGMANINMQYEIELGKHLLNNCSDLLSPEAQNEIKRTNKNTIQLLNKIKSISSS